MWRSQRERVEQQIEANRVDRLVWARQLTAQNDQIVGVLDETLDRYRADYHRAGAKYGASDKGMVRWFEERTINFRM